MLRNGKITTLENDVVINDFLNKNKIINFDRIIGLKNPLEYKINRKVINH